MDGTVRIGTVSDVNVTERTARIYYPDVDMMSDFLKVLSRSPDAGATGQKTDWMPEIGETVLCLYTSEWSGDGYVLGAIR